jgi:nucleotide-binding universal stress UspA family protein
LNVESELVLGYPAEKLVEYSEQHLLDLIVVGAKGLRATLGILLGGVAQQVVEYAHTPVMVVRPPYSGLRRVLLVTDGSENSRRALEYLATFPLPKGAEITVMHVLPPLVIEQPPLAWSQPDFMARPTLPPVDLGEAQKWEKEEEAQGKAVLEQAVAALSAAGIQARSLLQRGDAATEIIEYANAHSVDLIVAGSRGLSTFQAWLLGSVSRKLVHYAGCSVLVVKGK